MFGETYPPGPKALKVLSFCFPVNGKNKTADRVPQPPYSFDGPKEYAEKGLALRWALSDAKGRCVECLCVMGSVVRLCLFISTVKCGWRGYLLT